MIQALIVGLSFLSAAVLYPMLRLPRHPGWKGVRFPQLLAPAPSTTFVADLEPRYPDFTGLL